MRPYHPPAAPPSPRASWARTGHIAGGYRSTQLPAFAQKPRCGRAHNERIVRLTYRPHEVLALELCPARKQHTRRERVDQPGSRQPLLILPVLTPVGEHINQRPTCPRWRLDDLDVIAVFKHLAASPAVPVTEHGVDVPRRR